MCTHRVTMPDRGPSATAHAGKPSFDLPSRPARCSIVNLWRILRDYLGPYRRALAVVVVFQAVQAAAMMLLPTLNADLIDNGVLVGESDHVTRLGLVMIAVAIVQALFTIAAIWYGTRAAMGFGRDIRHDLFHRVTDFSAREMGHFGAGTLITRVTNDVQQIQLLVVIATTMMVAAPLTMVIGLVMAIREDVGLSVVLAVAIPVLAVTLGIVVATLVPTFQRLQGLIDRITGVLREQIAGIRVVRAFVREHQERQRFEVANDELTRVALRAGRTMAIMFPIFGTVISFSNVAVLWVGAGRIESGEMQVGSLVAYLSYLIQILVAVIMATFMVSMIPRSAVAAGRIVEIIDTPPSITPPVDPVTTTPEHGTLEFRNVEFRYPAAEQPVLADVSFRLEPGSTTAVIGSTGAGKTTLANLAVRLIDPTAGTVEVNGVDARRLDPAVLWRTFGYIPQRAFLFSGTVASNLRFGRPDATDEQLWAALEIAQAADFVRAKPEALEAPITQGGTNVSGGQRQRLAIARAIVAAPPIYIIDDAFSALDVATDARLRAALATHTTDAAVLVIAQRVSTIRNADEIVVLENGRVVGRGRHDDLQRTCETYRQIVDSQLGQDAA